MDTLNRVEELEKENEKLKEKLRKINGYAERGVKADVVNEWCEGYRRAMFVIKNIQ